MRRRATTAALGLAGIGALLALALALRAADPTPSRIEPTVASVERVLDGDTFDARIGARTVRIRLIGIDAPELHPSAKLDRQLRRGWDRALILRHGRRAADAARRLLAGRTVRLEFDVERRDRYGRLLAYVWLGDLLVNEALLRQGYAVRLTIPPNVRYVARFGAAEAAARREGRGLWSAWPPVRAR